MSCKFYTVKTIRFGALISVYYIVCCSYTALQCELESNTLSAFFFHQQTAPSRIVAQVQRSAAYVNRMPTTRPTKRLAPPPKRTKRRRWPYRCRPHVCHHSVRMSVLRRYRCTISVWPLLRLQVRKVCVVLYYLYFLFELCFSSAKC